MKVVQTRVDDVKRPGDLLFTALKSAGLHGHGFVQGKPSDGDGTMIDGTFDLEMVAAEFVLSLKDAGLL